MRKRNGVRQTGCEEKLLRFHTNIFRWQSKYLPNTSLLQLDSSVKPYHGIDPDRQTEKGRTRYLVLAEVSNTLKAILEGSIGEAKAVAG